MKPSAILVRAQAKLNLTLDILGKRPDGYHNLRSVMQTIALHDEVVLTRADTITVECLDPTISQGGNLAFRAAHLLRRNAGLLADKLGVTIELRKQVPVAAGLGGGSSDAAAILVGLNSLWGLDLSPEHIYLLAAQLGSDVPFFLTGGTMLAEGRGELLSTLPACSGFWLVLLKPPLSVSTRAAYSRFSPEMYVDGSATTRLCQALKAGDPLDPTLFSNSMEEPVWAEYPAIIAYRRVMLAAGASTVRMSGSGPTLYAPCPDLRSAADLYEKLQLNGHEVYLTHTV